MTKLVLITLGAIFAVAVAFLTSALLVAERPYKMASISMLPHFGPGQILHCTKDNARRLTYGDLVIYEVPDTTAERHVFTHMVVGLGGDTIQMKDGALWINGKAVPRRRVADFQLPGSNGKMVPQFEETFPGGMKTLVLSIDPENRLNNTDPIAVPANAVFVMGTNRDHSYDSRMMPVLGPVPMDNVICKAARDESTWRGSVS